MSTAAQRLRALLEKATPGPWETGKTVGVNDEQVFRAGGLLSLAFAREEADAALIVAMRNELPAILDALATTAQPSGDVAPLLAEPPSGGCFRWGLCEPPAKERAR